MKKLTVLLIAAVVAFGASAGVNNKMVKDVKVNVKEMKAMDRQVKTFQKGDVNVLPGIPLKAFDPTARPTTNHAFKAGETLFWDFEDEAQANDWTVWDDDEDGYGWEYTNGDGIKTHSGTGCVFSASYDNNYGVLYPDNWLISPTVTLGGTFSFYACGQDPSYASEYFTAYVYVNGDYIELGSATTTSVMRAYQYDLSEYEGMEGFVAIRHHNVSDMYRLNVDDITISSKFEPDPEPETPFVITDIPENCQVYTYLRNSSSIFNSWGFGTCETDGEFKVAFDQSNNLVYIQNPSWFHESYGSWVKGTYDPETGIISIPTGQYLNWSDAYGYGIILGWGSTYVYTNGDENGDGEDDYYMGYEIDAGTTEIQMRVDGNYIYLLDTEGDIKAEFPNNYAATGMMTYWSDDLSITALEFANRDEYGYIEPIGTIKTTAVAAIPANPTADDWYDCGDESGFSKFYFTLPTTDVDGNMLYPENLSYAVWINDGNGNVYQYAFLAADYTYDLYEDIYEVPYALYTNAVDFKANYVNMYRTNMNDNPLFVHDGRHNGNIGIQVFYTVDGVRNASEIAWTLPLTWITGDVDDDGRITIADVTDLIDMLLTGATSATDYPAADVDGDGKITIADVTDLIDILLTSK